MGRFWDTSDIVTKDKINDMYEGIGRSQSYFDFASADLTNIDLIGGSIEITSGEVLGEAFKVYKPSSIREWRNLKLSVSGLNANNGAAVLVRNELDTINLIPTTSPVNGVNIIDLSGIDASVHEGIIIKYQMARNLTSDTSPVISNNSITWEGVKSGAWIDLDNDILSSPVASINIDTDYGFDEYRIMMSFAPSVAASTMSIELNDDNSPIYNYTSKAIGIDTFGSSQTSFRPVSLSSWFDSGANHTTVVILRNPYLGNSKTTMDFKIFGQIGQRMANGEGAYISPNAITNVKWLLGGVNLVGAQWKLQGRYD